jgi:hypothetical protein
LALCLLLCTTSYGCEWYDNAEPQSLQTIHSGIHLLATAMLGKPFSCEVLLYYLAKQLSIQGYLLLHHSK